MGDILEILVEEQSMAAFLRGVLPKILSEKFTLDKNCRIHPHQGKSVLQKSIPQKVKAYRSRGYKNDLVHFVILHDQDLTDCKKLKQELKKLVDDNSDKNQRLSYKITIVCRELENWYFGDLDAVEKVIPSFKAQRYKNTKKFRTVDAIHVSGDANLNTLVENHGKTKLARDMSALLDIDKNTSQSLKNFVKCIREIDKL